MKEDPIKIVVLALYGVMLVLLGSVETSRSQTAPGFGDPLPDLTAEQRSLFERGRFIFELRRDVFDGLGPVFNDFGCLQCHDQPATGGASAVVETSFGRMVNGEFDPMLEYGGMRRQTTGINADGCQVPGEEVPSEATVVAERQSPPLFGFGLIDHIPVETILAQADPEDADGDGISGRPNMVFDPVSGQVVVGRFGWKAQVPSVLVFAADAELNEMGITTTIFPQENRPQGREVSCDLLPDPEDFDDDGDGRSDGMVALADFMTFLAPPPRGPIDENVRAGETIFQEIGCAKCHVPTMMTGPSPIAALNQKAVNLYSDLLLHDMGTLGDGIVEGSSTRWEMRTAPLWGLRATGKYLHHGRAETIEEAILMHGGEAEGSRSKFEALSAQQQRQLLAFLNSL